MTPRYRVVDEHFKDNGGRFAAFGEAQLDCKEDLMFIYTYSHCISDLLSCIMAADTLTALSILIQTKPSEMSLSSSASCEAPESEQVYVLGRTDLSEFAAAVDAASPYCSKVLSSADFWAG
jgi:hypothetical protein